MFVFWEFECEGRSCTVHNSVSICDYDDIILFGHEETVQQSYRVQQQLGYIGCRNTFANHIRNGAYF